MYTLEERTNEKTGAETGQKLKQRPQKTKQTSRAHQPRKHVTNWDGNPDTDYLNEGQIPQKVLDMKNKDQSEGILSYSSKMSFMWHLIAVDRKGEKMKSTLLVYTFDPICFQGLVVDTTEKNPGLRALHKKKLAATEILM